MQVYLVGGAVRDQLLGLDVYDNDYVVIGASPETMLSLGYQAVGKDFPVFLHPKTKQEYALARTERKSGKGYTGFECYSSPDVTLEQDLLRRDLTINAMAQNDQGYIIDPYQGQRDLEQKVLRHVSAAFSEDPLRILRVARFAAKLAHLGFQVAQETLELMRTMVKAGELEHLTAERVWQEWHKSLTTANPEVFLQVLRDCGALAVVLPEIDTLFGVPQPEKWHPEIDTGVHTLMVSAQAAKLSTLTTVRFAAQVHDLGKGITPEEEWPSHKLHCQTGQRLIKALCARLRIPNDHRDLALAVCAQHSNIHRAGELRPATFIKLFSNLDVWRKPERLEQVLICCEADHRGRLGLELNDYPQKALVETAYQVACSVDVQIIIADGFRGQEIKQELDKRRTVAIAGALER